MKFYFKRIYFTLSSLLKIVWWFFTRPVTNGANVLVFYKNEILLIRKATSKKFWSLPGGNSEAYEGVKDTAFREVKEEVGLNIRIEKEIGVYKETKYFRNHTTHVFLAYTDTKDLVIDPIEVQEARFFQMNSFPKNLGYSVQTALAFWEKSK